MHAPPYMADLGHLYGSQAYGTPATGFYRGMSYVSVRHSMHICMCDTTYSITFELSFSVKYEYKILDRRI
jgi:hypothetical protein